LVDRGEAFGPLAVGGVLRPDRCAAGCWIAFPRGMGGLESELLPERRGVIFEEAASAGAGAAVCCSSGAALGVWLTRISDPHHSFGFANLCLNVGPSYFVYYLRPIEDCHSAAQLRVRP